tara:strand:+ start:6223 stop:7368 length:1146 start_codon:yes stop_codon:yes gene_type:complete
MSADPYSLGGTFAGRLRGRGQPEGGVDARLSANPGGLQADVHGQISSLPFGGMKLRRDDAGALICTSGGLSVSCLDPEFERALEAAGGNDLNDQLSRLVGQKASSPWQHRITCSVSLLAFLAFLYFIPAMMRGCTAEVVEEVPFSVDVQLGEFANDQIDADSRVVVDEEVVDAIQQMVNRLSPHVVLADFPDRKVHFKLRIVESEMVNAYALPGGFITVYTGLIEKASSPEQVAGVLAHEIAHVTERHGLKRVLDNVGRQVAVAIVLGDISGAEMAAVEVFTMAAGNSYGRGQETDADVEGVRLMIDADLDPTAMAGFFELLRDEYGDVPDNLNWLSTHPTHGDRIANIRDLARDAETERGDREWIPLALDWDAVQAALRE